MQLFFIFIFIFLGGGGGGGGGGGWVLIRGFSCLRGGRLLTFPAYRVGTYSRWALIQGWALNQINKVISLL